jgi:hypothetical protein
MTGFIYKSDFLHFLGPLFPDSVIYRHFICGLYRGKKKIQKSKTMNSQALILMITVMTLVTGFAYTLS